MKRSTPPSDSPSEALLRTRRVIERDYDSALGVAHLAREAGLSRSHFVRAFSHAFRDTPHRHLLRTRLLRAKELLQQPDPSVTQVCYMLGFKSLPSFSAAFRREVGYSPVAYRRRLLEQASMRAQIPACYLAMLGPDRVSRG